MRYLSSYARLPALLTNSSRRSRAVREQRVRPGAPAAHVQPVRQSTALGVVAGRSAPQAGEHVLQHVLGSRAIPGDPLRSSARAGVAVDDLVQRLPVTSRSLVRDHPISVERRSAALRSFTYRSTPTRQPRFLRRRGRVRVTISRSARNVPTWAGVQHRCRSLEVAAECRLVRCDQRRARPDPVEPREKRADCRRDPLPLVPAETAEMVGEPLGELSQPSSRGVRPSATPALSVTSIRSTSTRTPLAPPATTARRATDVRRPRGGRGRDAGRPARRRPVDRLRSQGSPRRLAQLFGGEGGSSACRPRRRHGDCPTPPGRGGLEGWSLRAVRPDALRDDVHQPARTSRRDLCLITIAR